MKREPDIHCPRCGFVPGHEDRWSCVPSCGTVFHTFWTRGTCPGCGVQWPKTQCPSCQAFSLHAAWYHERPPAEDEQHERERPVEHAG